MDSTRSIARAIVADDEGLGLMEIVVAMFVLAILALSLLPLLITGMQASVRNTTVAAATQFANDRMAIAEAIAANDPLPCEKLEDLAEIPATMIDARGVELRADSTVGPCPSGTGTMSVATAVSRIDTGEVLARATTRVLLVAP